jgi:hypothetical protein
MQRSSIPALPKLVEVRPLDIGIVDSEVRLVRSPPLASEYDVLGTAVLAHLMALRFGGVIAKKDLKGLAHHTIRMYGHLYSANARRMTGYRQSWIGKAFEYAVTELFNRRSEPFWTLMRTGIERAVETHRGSRVKVVGIDLDRLSCIRVSKECDDTSDLVREFGSFRILQDARTSLEGAARRLPGLEEKVDALFCERETEAPRFTVTASLKVNREAFLSESVRRDFRQLPLDLGITVETARYREVRFDEEIGTHIVHLPMNVAKEIAAWEKATLIVERALVEGEKNKFLRWLTQWFRPNESGHRWVMFLADRIETEIDKVLQDIEQELTQMPILRSAQMPVLLGPEADAVLELGN